MMEKILVLEDDGLIRETIGLLLERKGYKPDLCETMFELLETVKGRKGDYYSILLFDLQYNDPKKGLTDVAFEALKRVRELGVEAPAILMSAGNSDSFEKYKEGGFIESIRKPFSLVSLMIVFDKVLEGGG